MADWDFWAVALLGAVAVTALLVQALRRGRAEAAAAEADLAVYKDQMAEIARDLARGTIGTEEAERLRSEVGRRVLDLDRQRGTGTVAAEAPLAPVAALIVAVVLGGGLATYWWLGAPGYPDLPIERRIALADERMATRPSQAEAVAVAPKVAPPEVDPDFVKLMDSLRSAVEERPDDPRGLELLARNETALGNFAAAEAAQRRLIAAKGTAVTAADQAALAEIMIAAAGGYVSPEAEVALQAALALDPTEGLARYYAGLMFVQAGRYDRGFALWSDLLETGPADAPWTEPLRAQIEEVAWRAGLTYQLPDARGPSAGDMATAAEMTPEERQAMIEGMVAQLSERLATEGGDVEDWDRLIRSLAVLERLSEAQTIYDEAKVRFEGRPAELSFLRLAAVETGLSP
ncbi:c-type cytochrome biogenesis protein CcmI [Tabrizicola aquatica]|uniref:c-type cytochrome biogenesis protein CcmI n=1 Tax=Tabrizicola aquatica TaxID=909926 RepID=UPI000CD26714|nr:c-type cytochrome biogenesis protein CcmI [Tabrizicola aquatica]